MGFLAKTFAKTSPKYSLQSDGHGSNHKRSLLLLLKPPWAIKIIKLIFCIILISVILLYVFFAVVGRSQGYLSHADGWLGDYEKQIGQYEKQQVGGAVNYCMHIPCGT
jgi:hypothetical protein